MTETEKIISFIEKLRNLEKYYRTDSYQIGKIFKEKSAEGISKRIEGLAEASREAQLLRPGWPATVKVPPEQRIFKFNEDIYDYENPLVKYAVKKYISLVEKNALLVTNGGIKEYFSKETEKAIEARQKETQVLKEYIKRNTAFEEDSENFKKEIARDKKKDKRGEGT